MKKKIEECCPSFEAHGPLGGEQRDILLKQNGKASWRVRRKTSKSSVAEVIGRKDFK